LNNPLTQQSAKNISYNGFDDPQVLPLISRAILRTRWQGDDDECVWS